MKKMVLIMLVTFLLFTYSTLKAETITVTNWDDDSGQGSLNGGNIVPGAGYSADSQQVASEICYNGNLSSISGSQSYFSLDTAKSFSELQKSLEIDVSTGGLFYMFSGGAEASYLRDIEDKDYSLSLNYYEYAAANAAVQINGYGEDALNDQGKTLYADGKNPYFGLVCGDYYFASYQEGAMLVMSINIAFKSHYEKENFDAKIGFSFADIFDASSQIQNIVTQYNVQGSVSINAFQKGGDPSQLSNILEKDPSGNYYALACDLQHMDDCVQAANGLLDYVNEDFATQFSFETGTGLTPLGVGFSQPEPIKFIGLVAPTSLVTPTVLADRLELADELIENQYYHQKFEELLYGYPVGWDTTGDLYKQAQKLYAVAENNIEVITSDRPGQGAQTCYDDPDQCDSTTKAIQSKLNPITQDDLAFLDQVKYIISTDLCAIIFNTGGNNATTSWDGVQSPGPGDRLLSFNSASFTNTTGAWDLDFEESGQNYHGWWSGTSSDGITYLGTFCDNAPALSNDLCDSKTQIKKLSPFYFKAYNSTISRKKQ